MLGAGGAGNHLRDVHGHQDQRGQNGDIHLFADADHRHVTVLYTGIGERFLFQIADDIGIFGIGAHLTNLFLVPVQHDEAIACVCKIHGEGIAESAEPDNTVNNVF